MFPHRQSLRFFEATLPLVLKYDVYQHFFQVERVARMSRIPQDPHAVPHNPGIGYLQNFYNIFSVPLHAGNYVKNEKPVSKYVRMKLAVYIYDITIAYCLVCVT